MSGYPSTQDSTKTYAEQIRDEMDTIDWIDDRIKVWEQRFESSASGYPENLLAIRRLDRLEADRREVKANIRRLRALRDAE